MTWLEALGPEQIIIWVNIYVESEFQVKNHRFLHPDTEKLDFYISETKINQIEQKSTKILASTRDDEVQSGF